MADIASLGIKIDSDQATTADKRLRQLTDSGKQTEQNTQKLESSWSKFSRTLITVNQGLQLASRVFGTVSRTITSLTSAWEANEQAAIRLESAWRASGGAVGLTVDELHDLTAELHGMTGIATQTIEEAQGIALTFHNIGAEEFPLAMKAAADMATIMDQDLRQSIQQVAFALNDPIEGVTRLRRNGVQFTDVQREMIREFSAMGDAASAQAIVLGELESQFGGAAEAMRDSARGSRMAFEETLDRLKSAMGRGLEEALRPGREKFIKFVNDNIDTIEGVFANLPEIIRLTGEMIVDTLEDALKPETLQEIFGAIGQYMIAAAGAGVSMMSGLFDSLYQGILAGAEELGEDWPKVLLNAIIKAADAPSRALLKLMGIDIGAPYQLEVGSTLGEGIAAAVSATLQGLGATYTQHFQTLVGELEILGEEIGDALGMDERIEEYKRRIQELIDAAKEAGATLTSDLAGGTDDGTDATHDFIAALQDENEELKESIMLFGESDRSALTLKMATMDLTEEEKKLALALFDSNEGLREIYERMVNGRTAAESLRKAQENLVDLWESRLMTDQEEISEQIADITAAYEAGIMPIETYAQALARLNEERMKLWTDEGDDPIESLADSIERIGEGALWNGIDNLVSSFRELGTELATAEDGMQSLGNVVMAFTTRLLDMTSGVLISIAQAMVASNPANWPLALGLIAGAAGISLYSGAAQGYTQNAQGNAYDGGNVIPFRTGGVVDQPTIFPMARGAGLMGEAGPEAIMPLKRTPSGDLGVQASAAQINVKVENYTSAQVSTERRQTPNGEELVFIINAAVRNAMNSGDLDGALSQNYGVRRKGIA